MVWQRPNPFYKSIYDNIAFGPKYHGIKDRQKLDEIVEGSLRKAALWDEVKDRLKDSRYLYPEANNKGFVLHGRYLSIHVFYCWMNQPQHLTLHPQRR